MCRRLAGRNLLWPRMPMHVPVMAVAVSQSTHSPIVTWEIGFLSRCMVRQLNLVPPRQDGRHWYSQCVARDPRQQRVPCDFGSGTSQLPADSRVLTPHGEVIVSLQMNHNKHQVALPVAPYFHARKALLLCGSFLGSILAAVTGA